MAPAPQPSSPRQSGGTTIPYCWRVSCLHLHRRPSPRCRAPPRLPSPACTPCPSLPTRSVRLLLAATPSRKESVLQHAPLGLARCGRLLSGRFHPPSCMRDSPLASPSRHGNGWGYGPQHRGHHFPSRGPVFPTAAFKGAPWSRVLFSFAVTSLGADFISLNLYICPSSVGKLSLFSLQSGVPSATSAGPHGGRSPLPHARVLPDALMLSGAACSPHTACSPGSVSSALRAPASRLGAHTEALPGRGAWSNRPSEVCEGLRMRQEGARGPPRTSGGQGASSCQRLLRLPRPGPT